MTDTDENNHLNEGGYLRFIMDAFYKIEKTKSKNHRIRRIQALYKKEILRRDICEIQLYWNSEENYYCAKFFTDRENVINLAFEVKFEFL